MAVSLISYLSDLFSLSDEQAMLRVQQKADHRAFDLLVRRWQQRIERLCARLTGDTHCGQDLTQEVFMRVFANRNDYRHQARFGTYIRRIAINVCYDERRRRSRRRESSLNQNDNSDNPEADLEGPTLSPDMVAAGREDAERVRKALFQLPKYYREVIVLRHYEVLRFREIAQVLDIPLGTVKSRMAKALSELERFLK